MDGPLGGDIRQPLDWSSSSFGLFTGLLSLVALIINLIVYFALVNQVCIYLPVMLVGLSLCAYIVGLVPSTLELCNKK